MPTSKGRGTYTMKEAKVMSAISHGWKPDKGDVAKIPTGVAKHLHAEDAGVKYGAKHKASEKWASKSYAKSHGPWKVSNKRK